MAGVCGECNDPLLTRVGAVSTLGAALARTVRAATRIGGQTTLRAAASVVSPPPPVHAQASVFVACASVITAAGIVTSPPPPPPDPPPPPVVPLDVIMRSVTTVAPYAHTISFFTAPPTAMKVQGRRVTPKVQHNLKVRLTSTRTHIGGRAKVHHAARPDEIATSCSVSLSSVVFHGFRMTVTPVVTANLARVKDTALELVGETTLTLKPYVSDLRVGVQFETEIGLPAETAAFTFFPFYPYWRYYYRPVYTRLRHRHRAAACLCARTRLTATLTSAGGLLTEIGSKKNKRLRIQIIKYPDFDENNPRYALRLVASENDEPCSCRDMYIGIYTSSDRRWTVGQERPVTMLSVTYGQFPAYDAESNFKVVMVKNLMYDIDIQAPSEIPRYVLFTGGCGDSYFLVNAECE